MLSQRVENALRMALEELRHAPCRDNPQHSCCLKCAAEREIEAVLTDAQEQRQGELLDD